MFLASGGNFNPIEHLYDRYSVWVTYWGAHGTAALEAWNGPLRGTAFEFLMVSQHVVMMWAVAFILIGAFSWATYARNTRVPKGIRNFLEPIVTYFRDEVVRPNIKDPHDHHAHGHDHGHDHAHGHDHHHDEKPKHWLADKFVPLFVCMFFFIAMVNLFGLIPGSTTASSAITFTGAMAGITLIVYVTGGFAMSIRANGGFVGGFFAFFKNLVPYKFSFNPIDMAVWLILFAIEFLGFIFIKPFALMVRLFANMTAGHCSLLSFLFINTLVPDAAWRIATGVPTVAMGVGLYALEIFVSILQAYIFVYLSAIFLGMYLVPEH